MQPDVPTPTVATIATERLPWADAAKGLCIVLVVLHHLVTKQLDLLVPDGSVVDSFWLGTTDALRPVRMPLFFLVSGMFATGALHRPWRDVVRRRIATPYYVYAVWLVIHALVFSVLTALPMNRSRSLSELAGDLVLASTGLWYLYALALYFVIAKLLLRFDTRVVIVVAAVASGSASLLPIAAANRESLLQHFVFFLVGAALPQLVRRIPALPGRHVTAALLVGTASAFVAAAALGLPQSITTLLVSIPAVPLAIRLVAAACTVTQLEATASWLGRRTLPIYVLHVPLLALMHHLVVQVDALRHLADAPAGLLVLAVHPVIGTALITVTSLLLHSVLVRAGLGVLFRLPTSSRSASSRAQTGAATEVAPATN